jgi:hypothetical protein
MSPGCCAAKRKQRLDSLMGIVRLEFIPAFAGGVSSSAQISRLAASESDLYMLDAERVQHSPRILYRSKPGIWTTRFHLPAGTHGGYRVARSWTSSPSQRSTRSVRACSALMPERNFLYCSPGQVPQVFPLPPLPNTNWGRVTAFVLDATTFYVLDAEARAVWVYPGKDSAFTRPALLLLRQPDPGD